MAFNQEAYKELELIVGKRWISQDIAERECYRSIMAESSAHSGPYDGETPLPGAVILPGSTEEVQAIVKICNKYDIHFKACSTFWSSNPTDSTPKGSGRRRTRPCRRRHRA